MGYGRWRSGRGVVIVVPWSLGPPPGCLRRRGRSQAETSRRGRRSPDDASGPAGTTCAQLAHHGCAQSAPLTTKARTLTARRVLSAVKRISGAGVLEFVAEPTGHAAFAAL